MSDSSQENKPVTHSQPVSQQPKKPSMPDVKQPKTSLQTGRINVCTEDLEIENFRSKS